ncbi:MAG: outer membrane protein assembly factor BamD [Hyphomicrobiales bacterium]|nr:outer membrane protein assembly factor BamD [Hyphomicrobiales bacterium]
MNIRNPAKLTVLAIVIGLLSGCAGSLFGEDGGPQVEAKSAEELFKEANAALDEEQYSGAATKFEEVDRQYPYSEEARESILMAAYSYQKAGKSPEAVASARRYLTLHPGTKEAALAQHIVAEAYYERINDASRDQSDTKAAIVELETLINRYPDSKYVEQARKRVRLARDIIAAAEMNIGRWYQDRGQFLAAINRYRTVVSDYQNTAHVEEALMRLTECYYTLGIVNEAQTAAAILGHNFPDSKWYKDAYALLEAKGLEPREDSGSWLSRQWNEIVSAG